MKSAGRIVLVFASAAAIAGGAWVWRGKRVEPKADLATATARHGDFQVIVRTRGELTSIHSVQLVAPVNIPGLQIAWQAPTSGPVKKGDLVIRFDSSAAHQQLREKEAGLEQAEATLRQAEAQSRVTSEQDKVDVNTVRIQLERQQLEASKREIVGRLQGESSRIDLGVAEERLHLQEAMADFHSKASASQIASLTRQRDKAKQDVELTSARLSNMELRAPTDGLVVYQNNYSQGWLNAQPFKVGDAVWPGSSIAEIPDLTTLELKGKLEEVDRGRVVPGQETRIKVDPLPEKVFAGTLDLISPLVEQNFEWPPSRNFRAYARFSQSDPRLRPGMNGQADIVVQHIPDAISVPTSALFTRHGRPAVYVDDPTGWLPREVEIVARNPDEVAVRGISAGTKVALVEPDVKGAQ